MDNAAAANAMNSVFAMETRLANASRKLADLRDPYKNYHKMPLAKFAAAVPNLELDKYLPILNINKLSTTECVKNFFIMMEVYGGNYEHVDGAP